MYLLLVLDAGMEIMSQSQTDLRSTLEHGYAMANTALKCTGMDHPKRRQANREAHEHERSTYGSVAFSQCVSTL